MESALRTIASLAAVLTIVVAVIQYGLTKRSEFRKRFWEEQLALYRRVCSVAGALASAEHIANVETERNEFWKLFWGELSIVEHGNVKQAMEKFGTQLRQLKRAERHRERWSSSLTNSPVRAALRLAKRGAR